MLNNIKDLFLKYKNQINSKKDIENKTILFFKEELKLDLLEYNLKIDIKNKKVYLINLNSSYRFFIQLKNKEEIKKLYFSRVGLSLII